jgi:hypothetical protein
MQIMSAQGAYDFIRAAIESDRYVKEESISWNLAGIKHVMMSVLYEKSHLIAKDTIEAILTRFKFNPNVQVVARTKPVMKVYKIGQSGAVIDKVMVLETESDDMDNGFRGRIISIGNIIETYKTCYGGLFIEDEHFRYFVLSNTDAV